MTTSNHRSPGRSAPFQRAPKRWREPEGTLSSNLLTSISFRLRRRFHGFFVQLFHRVLTRLSNFSEAKRCFVRSNPPPHKARVGPVERR